MYNRSYNFSAGPATMPVPVLEEIRDEGKTFPVECQFCDTVYSFTPEEIRELIRSSK